MTVEARLIDGFDALLADLDGVVYAGQHAIEGAVEALESLARRNVALAYVTNNASRSAEVVAAHLRSLGAPARADQVFGSALAGAELLATRVPAGSRVLVTGSSVLADLVRAQGLDVVPSAEASPDAVIQGFSPDLGWKDLAEAAYAVSAGAVWVATNTDLSIPQARGIAPGNGTLVAAVAAATGKQPIVAGKPEAALFETAARHVGARKALVVGDRLDTDIRGGNRAGMKTALVLTGVDTLETALSAVHDERPDYLIPSLTALYEPYPIARVEGAVHHRGQASARVDGDSVLVEGAETDLDAWRAACSAWWTAQPRQDSVVRPRLQFKHRKA